MGKSRGGGIVLALMALLAFSLLAVAVFTVTKTQMKESLYLMRQAQAKAFAEAAAEDALLQLVISNTWKAGYTNKSFAGGTYNVIVSTGNPPTVKAVGFSKSIPLFGAAVREVAFQTAFSGYADSYAALASNSISVNGVMNAYDSSVSSNPGSFGVGADAWSNATVATNAGAVRINGNAVYFSGAAPSAATVAGTIVKTTTTLTLPFHDGTAYLAANNNAVGLTPASVYTAANMKVSVGAAVTATLQPGVYYFKQMTINGTLNVNASSGPVTIYLAGNLSGGGSFVNQSGYPGKLIIYGQSAMTLTVNFAAPLHAYIEANTGTMTLTSALYGKVVLKSLTIAAAGQLHYDKQFEYTSPTAALWQPGTWVLSYSRQ